MKRREIKLSEMIEELKIELEKNGDCAIKSIGTGSGDKSCFIFRTDNEDNEINIRCYKPVVKEIPINKEAIENIAKNFNIGIVLSIHDPNLAMRYCNEAILLKDGKVLRSGKTKEILCQESLLKVYDMEFEVLYSKNGINFVSL